MKLRERIDLGRSYGLTVETAVIVNFRTGKASGIAEEMDISQLQKYEIRILMNAGHLTRKEVKEAKKDFNL